MVGKEDRQRRARIDWDPPGPVPPGCTNPLAEDESLDALCGHWKIFQLKKGHRYSTDDLLGAWYATHLARLCGISPRRILDLGTGIGSIGMMLAWKYPAATVLGIEKQPRSAALARRSIRYNGLEERMRVLEGDLKEIAIPESFDLVTGSPPYWDVRSGVVSEQPQKGPCRFEEIGRIEDYCRKAAELLAPGGIFTLVFDGRQRARAERAAFDAGWEIFRLREVVSREGDPPLLLLMGLVKTRSTEPSAEPSLLLREKSGTRSEEFRRLRAEMGFPPGPR